MNVRFISNPPAWRGRLLALVLPLGAGAAAAQALAPPAPATAGTAPIAYRSALEGYQAYTDEKTVHWKEANDNAGRMGGWREYAKEARQAQTPDAAKPDPRAAPAKP